MQARIVQDDGRTVVAMVDGVRFVLNAIGNMWRPEDGSAYAAPPRVSDAIDRALLAHRGL